jgi:hypothetical protein
MHLLITSMRNAHREHRGALADVWDTAGGCYRLPAFAPALSSWHTFFMERLGRMEDAQLLANFSTSPLHESGWFCDGERGRGVGLVCGSRGASLALLLFTAANTAAV